MATSANHPVPAELRFAPGPRPSRPQFHQRGQPDFNRTARQRPCLPRPSARSGSCAGPSAMGSSATSGLSRSSSPTRSRNWRTQIRPKEHCPPEDAQKLNSSAATRNRCCLQPLSLTPAALPRKNRTGMRNAGGLCTKFPNGTFQAGFLQRPFRGRPSTHRCPSLCPQCEWNSPAYDPRTNLILTGDVDWCTTVKVQTREEILAPAPGQPWMGERSLNPFNEFGKQIARMDTGRDGSTPATPTPASGSGG